MLQIAILLATYNSDHFLSALLDSIFAQSNKEWELFIIDDGSEDETLDIINYYQSKYGKIHLVLNPNKHSGPKNNFLYLLSLVDASYYMFCDHDDVWLPYKIEKSMKQMHLCEDQNEKRPVLIHSDLYVVDVDLKLISSSFFEYAGLLPNILLSSSKHLAHSNCVTGCTMLFNQKAKRSSLPASKYALMHDSWIALKVLKNGGIIYCIKEPLVLYRQHSNNALGAVKKKHLGFFEMFKGNWKQYKMSHSAIGIHLIVFILYKFIYKIRYDYFSSNSNV